MRKRSRVPVRFRMSVELDFEPLLEAVREAFRKANPERFAKRHPLG